MDDFVVENEDLAKIYMKEIIKNIKVGDVIGTNFRVKTDSNQILYQKESDAGPGIWIGWDDRCDYIYIFINGIKEEERH